MNTATWNHRSSTSCNRLSGKWYCPGWATCHHQMIFHCAHPQVVSFRRLYANLFFQTGSLCVCFQNQNSLITERQNVACRLIMKAISKGSLADWLVHLDAGSTTRLAQQNLQIPEHASNRILPSWLFYARLSARDKLTSSRPARASVMPFWALPYLLNTQIAYNSSFAPGASLQTTQQRCTQSSGAQCQQEGDTPCWG